VQATFYGHFFCPPTLFCFFGSMCLPRAVIYLDLIPPVPPACPSPVSSGTLHITSRIIPTDTPVSPPFGNDHAGIPPLAESFPFVTMLPPYLNTHIGEHIFFSVVGGTRHNTPGTWPPNGHRWDFSSSRLPPPLFFLFALPPSPQLWTLFLTARLPPDSGTDL